MSFDSEISFGSLLKNNGMIPYIGPKRPLIRVSVLLERKRLKEKAEHK